MRIGDGKSKNEAFGCLKHDVARAVYNPHPHQPPSDDASVTSPRHLRSA
jgi:hypothetical protein